MILFNSKMSSKFRVFSNMSSNGFVIKDKGERYYMKCMEMFFVYCKSLNIEDRKKILDCKDGFECRKVGRKVRLREDWNKIKVDVMRFGLKKKFENKKMKEVLLSSGDEKLVEDSSWDGFWGNGKDGNGKNIMGKLLMEIREELRK
jgi:N-glycosidase YbiA